MRQSQGTLLPQVRLDASKVENRLNQRDLVPGPVNNDKWISGHEGSVVVRQLLFDGFASVNEIWRQTARVDAASHRVLERTELIALDAVNPISTSCAICRSCRSPKPMWRRIGASRRM